MGKNSYLGDYAMVASKGKGAITTTEIAKLAKKDFKLKGSVESIRKAISKELSRHKLQEVTFSKPKEQVRQDKFTTPGDYLVLGCLHVPGHNKAMFNGVIELIKDMKDLKGLMLIGDFLDMNALSGHNKGQFTAIPGLTLDGEYKAGNEALDKLLINLPKDTSKVYIYGNHEDRWNRYMSDMQNAKAPIKSPKEALYLEERGFNVFENWSSDYVTLGAHLELLHGQYYNTHCAKQHIDKLRGSVMFAHTHRIQMYVEGKTGGFNIGWGGDVSHPFFNYAERGTKTQWMNGFAIVHLDDKGNYFVNQIFCYDNKFYYNGKTYC